MHGDTCTLPADIPAWRHKVDTEDISATGDTEYIGNMAITHWRHAVYTKDATSYH